MKPVGKYILIKAIEEEIKTKSGLILSNEDANSFRYKKGEVVQTGDGVQEIKSKDSIYYDRHAGHSMLIHNESYTIITERDVVVVL
jgi:co-chaperonin GroES (HSP10)|tara:strand:+ start:825 stop:1082 length:258 start_codon:yes stop_codon:yes gene_type:complete